MCPRDFVKHNFWNNNYWIPFLNFFLSLCEFFLTVNYINGIANMYKKMSLIYGGGKEEEDKKKSNLDKQLEYQKNKLKLLQEN